VLPALPGTSNTPLPGAGAGGLFPTVGPSATPGLSPGAQARPGGTAPVTVSSVLPLNSRLVGSQIAGVAVLVLGVAIAITRLSVRKPRPSAGKK